LQSILARGGRWDSDGERCLRDLVAKLDTAVIDGTFASVDHSHLPGAAVAIDADGSGLVMNAIRVAGLRFTRA
jgi:hypothetical protein